jgi:hypothetical protein
VTGAINWLVLLFSASAWSDHINTKLEHKTKCQAILQANHRLGRTLGCSSAEAVLVATGSTQPDHALDRTSRANRTDRETVIVPISVVEVQVFEAWIC